MTYPSRLSLGLTAAVCLSATISVAEDAQTMADLPKDEFLTAYADNYVASLETTQRLIMRIDPAFEDVVDPETPLSEAERDSYECIYDYHAKSDALVSLAQAVLVHEKLDALYEENPELSYVDLLFDKTLQEELIPEDSDVTQAAMQECGAIAMSAERLKLTPEFWGKLQANAIARGFELE